MSVSAFSKPTVSPRRLAAWNVLRTAAAGVGTVLACVACQPDTGAKNGSQPAAQAPAPIPPVPSAPGQVSEGVNLDLKQQITEAVISADPGGAKMALERKPASIN